MSLIKVVIDPVLKLRPSGYGRIFCGFRIKIKDSNGIWVFVTSNNKIKIKSQEVRRDGKSLFWVFSEYLWMFPKVYIDDYCCSVLQSPIVANYIIFDNQSHIIMAISDAMWQKSLIISFHSAYCILQLRYK